MRSVVGDRKTGVSLDGIVVQPSSTPPEMDRTIGTPMSDVRVVGPTDAAMVAEGTRGEFIGDLTQPQSPGGDLATLFPVSQHGTHPPRLIRMVAAKELSDRSDPNSWDWDKDENSLHGVIARLKWVTRFTAAGGIQCSLPPGAYVLSWRILMVNPCGWHCDPVHFFFWKNGVLVDERKCFMNTSSGLSNRREQLKLPRIRLGKYNWREFDVGEFVVESEDTVSHLEFAMTSSDGDCKTGFFLDGVVLQQLCPSGCSLEVSSALADTLSNSLKASWISGYWIYAGKDDHINLVSDPTSLHLKSARLEKVTSFEASMTVDYLLPPGTYTVSWRIRLDNPGGWDAHPVHFTLSKDDVQIE